MKGTTAEEGAVACRSQRNIIISASCRASRISNGKRFTCSLRVSKMHPLYIIYSLIRRQCEILKCIFLRSPRAFSPSFPEVGDRVSLGWRSWWARFPATFSQKVFRKFLGDEFHGEFRSIFRMRGNKIFPLNFFIALISAALYCIRFPFVSFRQNICKCTKIFVKRYAK